MAASIPASAIVNVLPSVVSAGGNGLDLVGLILTNNTQAPVGAAPSFSNLIDVANYFGPLSTEALMASTYFAGYDGSIVKPESLLFYRYVDVDAPAYLRGGKNIKTLAQIQALSGTLIVTVNGSVKTSSTINLSAATSFSNAAAIIQAGFTTPGFVASYDAITGAFVFTTTTTGAGATIGFFSGTLAANLKLSQSQGAVTSQGAIATAPATAMGEIVALTQNFVSFTTSWEPSDSDKLNFAIWADAQSNRYLYVGWDNNAAATVSGDTTTVTSQIKAAGYSATVSIFDYNNGPQVAAFLMGSIASVDFGAQNGRATLAFRTGNVSPGVTNQSIGANLIANGSNFVGAYATANSQFTFFYPGQVSGVFGFIDSWICQAWMNSRFQLALMTLLTSVGQVPYNAAGYDMIKAALRGVIDDALNFGAIRAGVKLSASQKVQVNNAVGGDVAGTLEQTGFYIKVADPGAVVRGQRGSPDTRVFYTDGQSVQQITLSSVNVQ